MLMHDAALFGRIALSVGLGFLVGTRGSGPSCGRENVRIGLRRIGGLDGGQC
jgi:hypothetical protein